MIWKQYQNELLVALTALLLLFAIGYKSLQVTQREESFSTMQDSLLEFKELLTYKKRWVDKKTPKKVEKLKNLVPASKVKWEKKGKKLHARYADLSAKELNKISTTLLNLPVQIEMIDLKQSQGTYDLELKCKW